MASGRWEITNSHFYIWDLLSVNDTDLRGQPYEIRYVHLTRLFRGVHELLRVCETAMTPKAKGAFVKAMRDANAEALSAKQNTPPTRVGERDNTTSVSCRHGVLHRWPEAQQKADDGHRSIACISWRRIGPVSWAPWECPTAIYSLG